MIVRRAQQDRLISLAGLVGPTERLCHAAAAVLTAEAVVASFTLELGDGVVHLANRRLEAMAAAGAQDKVLPAYWLGFDTEPARSAVPLEGLSNVLQVHACRSHVQTPSPATPLSAEPQPVDRVLNIVAQL